MGFLDELNEAQRASVLYNEGPQMVIAGAGSGKTRVLTYKIAYLIQQGYNPYNILALTFTNKAAGEMKERIAQLVGGADAKGVWMGTFHSVFSKILRREAEKIGFMNNFTIYNQEDSEKLLTTIVKRMQLDEKKLYKPKIILGRISNAKNNLISPARYQTMPNLLAEDRYNQREYVYEVYKEYQKKLFQNSAMDFDDLLYYTNILFRDFPEVKAAYQNRFKYILVDEFQDTNFSQYLAIRQMALNHGKVCVVGDDAQSIYGFRGADIDNIVTNFRNDFPSYQLFKLEENYRSTKHIVAISNEIIKKNKNQIPKEIYTNNSAGELIDVYPCINENHEAQQIAKEIELVCQQQGVRYSDFAILYRTNAQSRVLEDALRKYKIPYKIWGGLSFYQRKEIKDILAYLRLVVNSNDNEAIKRVINYPPRGIGDASVEKIFNYAYDNNISAFQLLENVQMLQNELNISNRAIQNIRKFIEGIKNFINQKEKIDVSVLVEEMIKFSEIIPYLEQTDTEENKERVYNIKELLNAVRDFANTTRTVPEQETFTPQNDEALRTIEEFMSEVSLLTTQDERDSANATPKVVLMTIHLSKGLEFPYVFITGLEEGLIPSSRSFFDGDIEEERRLLYVAVTRAKKKAHLSFAQRRFFSGRNNSAEPSRFLSDIPSQFINMKKTISATQQPYNDYNDHIKVQEKPIYQEKKNFIAINKATTLTTGDASVLKNKDLQQGQQVMHEKFGKGIVMAIIGSWPESKATINFENIGSKVLLLKFAKLELL